MSGKVLYGRTDGRTADKKRRKNFFLGSPDLIRHFSSIFSNSSNDADKVDWPSLNCEGNVNIVTNLSVHFVF